MTTPPQGVRRHRSGLNSPRGLDDAGELEVAGLGVDAEASLQQIAEEGLITNQDAEQYPVHHVLAHAPRAVRPREGAAVRAVRHLVVRAVVQDFSDEELDETAMMEVLQLTPQRVPQAVDTNPVRRIDLGSEGLRCLGVDLFQTGWHGLLGHDGLLG